MPRSAFGLPGSSRIPAALGALCLLFGAAACEPPDEEAPGFPEPDAWGPRAGPGTGTVTYDEADLWQHCAYLDGGLDDADHHNLVTVYDGWLVMPWAPEWSYGGLSFFDFSDPCDPVKVGEGEDHELRESHTIGFAKRGDRIYTALDWHGGVVDAELIGGVQIWDVTDPTAPRAVSTVALPGYVYPDSYARVTLSTFWQGDTIYAAGSDNGVWMVDASDPLAPRFAAQHTFDPVLRVGAVHAIGDVLMVSSAEGARTVLMDISDPLVPQIIPGGDFLVTDSNGDSKDYYFSNVGGKWGLFARKEGGGGFAAFDISEPSAPVFDGEFFTADGNGGYVFLAEDHVFVGDSNFAGVYDFSDPSDVLEVGRAHLEGDLDTATPIGNVFVLSVDEDSVPDQASAVVPWRTDSDARGPTVGWHRPPADATFVSTTGRVGLSFDEGVDGKSVFAGSFRVATADGTPVPGRFNAQENVVNFSSTTDLEPDTTYVVTVPAGGIIDFAGNPIEEGLEFRFSTGGDIEGGS